MVVERGPLAPGAMKRENGSAKVVATARDVDAGTVTPHRLSVAIWDAPPAVERAKPFRLTLGVKCSGECRPDAWTIEVRDHEGRVQAAPRLSDTPWPGTTALYHAVVDLRASDTEGLHTWVAAASAVGPEVPHGEGLVRFGVRVVSRPDHRLTVVAIDAERQTPVPGVRVVVHPYRAVTDERGVAEVRVPAGDYRLFVSGKGYSPFRRDGEVREDLTITAALELDRGLSDADIWS